MRSLKQTVSNVTLKLAHALCMCPIHMVEFIKTKITWYSPLCSYSVQRFECDFVAIIDCKL